ncbi:MAG TPA: CapA family protein [Dehalococcoidia bacterium]|nr:CapA family protein [Dehalococcoidia bacterium]
MRSAGIVAICALALTAIGCSRGAGAPPPATAAPTATATPVPVPTIEPVTRVLFTGDIIPARCTYAKVQALGGDWTQPFRPLHDVLSSADLTAGSLDSTISDAGTPYGCIETFSLAGPAAAADGLAYAGFDVMAHAANHVKDCGVSPCGDEALLQTAVNLRARGIVTAGDGADLAAARTPRVVERNGVRFAFLAYDDIAPYYHADATTAGAAAMDPATVGEDIARARAMAEVVIVMPHWGIEYTSAPSERQREFARACAAAGATLVIGNHPHWVQAHEQIGNTFVAYALGNFVFDQDWSLETQQGAMLEVTFTGSRVTGTRYLPVHIFEQYQPRLAAPDEAASILGRIEEASAGLR